MRWLFASLVTVMLAGCFSIDDVGSTDIASTAAAVLPPGVDLALGEEVHRNGTDVRFLWSADVPFGVGELTGAAEAPHVSTELALPAEVPLGIFVRVDADTTDDLELVVQDAAGTLRCRSVTLQHPEGCRAVWRPDDAASPWTIRVSVVSPTGSSEHWSGVPIDVTVEVSSTAHVWPAPDARLAGCAEGPTAVAHGVGGVLLPETAPTPRGCLYRVGTSGLEPTLGIDAEGRVFAYPAVAGPIDAPWDVAVTEDDGETWRFISPPPPARDLHRTSNDPYLHLDRTTGRVFATDLVGNSLCELASWTDDGGASWATSASGCSNTDHQTVFTGPPTLGPTLGYDNIVYNCAMSGGALAHTSTASSCERSRDGGLTWHATGQMPFTTPVGGEGHNGRPYCDGGVGHGTTDSRGTVLLPKGVCGVPMLAISDDEGTTWTRVQVSTLPLMADARGDQAHDAGVAADAADNLYYFWIARDRLPYLATSVDGGFTWGDPMMVGPPGLAAASQPALVAGAAGRVAFAYMGSWDASPAIDPCLDASRCLANPLHGATDLNATWHGVIGMTADALAAPPTFITSTTNHPAAPLVVGDCGVIRCQEVYDFIDIAIHPDGTPWAVFVDGCSSTLTRCGHSDGQYGELVLGRLVDGPRLVD